MLGEWWITWCGWNTWYMHGIRLVVWGRSWKPWLLCGLWSLLVPDGPIDSTFCPQPNLFQILLSLSQLLVRMTAACGDCKLSSFQWLLRCLFSRKSFHAAWHRVNDFPLTIPAKCRTSPSPKCIYSAFRTLCPQFTFWCDIFAFSLYVLHLSI